MNENYQNNEQETKTYLEKVGIHTDIMPLKPSVIELEKQGYKKLPRETFGYIGMTLQQIPGLATHSISRSGAYKVVIDGPGELQKAKNWNWFYGTVVEGTNNNIKEQAKHFELSSTTISVHAVFSIMSAITGQYYLTQINSKLSDINNKIDGIRQFLEADKRSHIWGRQQFIMQTINGLDSIRSNELQKMPTISQLQSIRLEAMADIDFYSVMVQSKISEIKSLSSDKGSFHEKALDLLDEISSKLPLYWCSVYLFSMAYYLETVLSDNMDKAFLELVYNEIYKARNNYKNLITNFRIELEDIIENASAYKTNDAVMKLAEVTSKGVNTVFRRTGDKVQNVADKFAQKNEEKKEKARSEITEHMYSLVEQCSNYKPITEIENNLYQYNTICNYSKLEILCTDDDTYVKTIRM